MIRLSPISTNAASLRQIGNACAVALVLLALAGCQTIKPSWLGNSPQVKESLYAAPARMAIIWSPAVLNQAGQPPTRGFGGRAYFYDAANRPIAVEGQLVVYAYDDTQATRDSRAADRKYAFTPEQLRSHYSPSDLGASYSVWIPWDPVGGPQLHINLVPVFTATSGQLVMGQASPNVLPGHNTPEHQPHIERHILPPPQIDHGGVQQASFHEASQPARTGTQELSIRLPGTMAERLAAAGPQGQVVAPAPMQFVTPAAPPPPARPSAEESPPQTHFAPPLIPVRAPVRR